MQVNVAELSWEEVKEHIYTLDGSLPDTYVLDVNCDDWYMWVDFINTNYKVVFRYTNEQEHEKIDFAAVLECWNNVDAENWPLARIFVGDIQIRCFFLAEDIIDGDIDPREFKKPDDHLQLIHYLTSISKLLGKQVVVLSEGTRIEDNNRFNPEPLLTIQQGGIWTSEYWL
ncbi:hypothetical protein [Hymenobacter gelipurpurascens]|nr:hypothetical protein [Hymenobacter gelipurpurascens]